MSVVFTLPKFMAGICFDKYGDSNVLQFRTNLPVPELKTPQDVLVQVHYASVNPVDWKIRNGNLSLFFKPAFPIVPGQDASGVVVQSNSNKFKQGDPVFGLNPNGGTNATYSLYKDTQLAKKPENISYADAAGLPTVALATKQAFDWAKLESGQRVLIVGGAGGVGSYAIQYAKKVIGAEVYATCSVHNVDYLKQLGADHIIDHNIEKFEVQIPECDVIIDTVGTEEMRKRLWSSLVNRKGKFVALGMGEKQVTWRDLVLMGTRGTMRKVIAFLFRRPSYKLMSVKPNGNDLEQIAELHVKHDLSLGHVTRCYDLNENNARIAHKLSESRHTRGKILFQIASLLPERELLKTAVNK